MVIDPTIFRDYDIRGIVPDQLDEEGLRRIAQALVQLFKPKSIQIGRDTRISSPSFHKIFIETLLDSGVNVVDLGFSSTDMLYFAAGKYSEEMAVNISASHNPPEYNGLKIVKKGAIAVSGRSGIYDLRDLALSKKDLVVNSKRKGKLTKREILTEFRNHVLGFIDLGKMKHFKVVSDTGNGMAGYFMPAFEEKLPWSVTRMYYELDGTFPNHVPSPIEEKNRLDCINKLKETKADFGLVFDGDGDRVYMIDEKGRTVSGTIMTAIIAESLLQKNPGSSILYNAIIGRVVPEIVKEFGGKALRVRVGHTLIKEDMRKYDGLFCGEHSGHYFFKKNFYADSAIIAALLVVELMSVKEKKLSELYDNYNKYRDSGEINFVVQDKESTMKSIEKQYKDKAFSVDWLDGVSVWFKDWWFNVRPSNTEPLLRLNIEADNQIILEEKTKELITEIEKLGGKEKI
ncbi:phosphomannomutase/phosphoglucomutase [Candidatus Woesebacteria bacterium]|nr:phosphomannomutase/phosphoglucomutase [Candidatus Woesebacteria bacterium]